MDDDEALAQIREALGVLERSTNPRPVVPVGAGQDVIAIPFFFCANKARAEITRRVFHHLRGVAEELGARVIGLGSEGEVSRRVWCSVFDEMDYHEYPQPWTSGRQGGAPSGAGSDGLRAKFDETVRRARVFDPRRVFIGGSDDVISLDWWRQAWKSEADLIGVTGGARIVRYGIRPEQSVLMSWDGKYSWATDVEFCGGGVVMSRALLDGWRWAPFDEAGDEIRLERRAREEGWAVEAIPAESFWAIKAPGAVLNEAARARRVGAAVVNDVALRADWNELWKGLA